MTLAAAATYILIAVWPINGVWIERREAATTKDACEVAAQAAVHCPKCKPLDVDGPARQGALHPGQPVQTRLGYHQGVQRPMTRLPAKRVRPRSGIERGPPREWPRHRKFVRSHGCCVPGCQGGPIVFAHVRSAANAGTAIKPHDCFGISLCDQHHKSQHQIGQRAFEREHGIDMMALAQAFTRRSPDVAMRESLKLMEAANG